MISLSEEWGILSRAMYGKDFIEELSDFLKKQNVETILECGCGDGNILRELAKRGLKGIGIDGDRHLIQEALKNNVHKNIEYKYFNWVEIEKLKGTFDSIICRGNSLSYVVSWDKKSFNQNLAKKEIEKSISLFFDKLRKGGLLYVDTIPQKEIDEGGGKVKINTGEIYLEGEVIHDWKKRLRYIGGSGMLGDKYFSGGSSSYLDCARHRP